MDYGVKKTPNPLFKAHEPKEELALKSGRFVFDLNLVFKIRG